MRKSQLPTVGSSAEAFAITLNRQQLEDTTEGFTQLLCDVPCTGLDDAGHRFVLFERFDTIFGKPVVI